MGGGSQLSSFFFSELPRCVSWSASFPGCMGRKNCHHHFWIFPPFVCCLHSTESVACISCT